MLGLTCHAFDRHPPRRKRYVRTKYLSNEVVVVELRLPYGNFCLGSSHSVVIEVWISAVILITAHICLQICQSYSAFRRLFISRDSSAYCGISRETVLPSSRFSDRLLRKLPNCLSRRFSPCGDFAHERYWRHAIRTTCVFVCRHLGVRT